MYSSNAVIQARSLSSGSASSSSREMASRRCVRASAPGRRRPASGRTVLLVVARATRADMSAQMKSARQQMEENEDLSILMSGLRGSNVSEQDFASDGVVMNVVEVDDNDFGDSLPLNYDPELIATYWQRRPLSVVKRIVQLGSIAGGFFSRLAWDVWRGDTQGKEVERAIELRNIVTSLGPAYIKLGQALSIRPDLLSPAAMRELQKLCDKVPSFPNETAMKLLEQELGGPWTDFYEELGPNPVAAASLGQVYKGKIKGTGEIVAVKVQRPYVLETVTIDLYILRRVGVALRSVPQVATDIVGLLDEWASRFFEELDYVREGSNATRFAADMAADLPQIVVPKTYSHLTQRRVLTSQWLDGEKLSQSTADDVGELVKLGVICFLKQLLDTGFFHADPHPGNLIRTPDGRLAILDFGLMTEIKDDVKYGMIEAISHLIHRDYENIVQDFVTLDFIPPGVDLKPILPVLAKVFDQALEGGGAKNFNFQELAADLAQITFDYPFRIPPYFALIIRAIGVLEGIALVGDPDFALVDEAYPYISKRLLTDKSPRLRAALTYMVYGKSNVFDAERLIDILESYEEYAFSSTRNGGIGGAALLPAGRATEGAGHLPEPAQGGAMRMLPAPRGFPQLMLPMPGGFSSALMAAGAGRAPWEQPARPLVSSAAALTASGGASNNREALQFLLSREGEFFREFLLEEIVKGIDATARVRAYETAKAFGLQNARLPVLLPIISRRDLPLTPPVTDEDRKVVENITKLVVFLAGGGGNLSPTALREMLPMLPSLAVEVLPELGSRLGSRLTARFLREVMLDPRDVASADEALAKARSEPFYQQNGGAGSAAAGSAFGIGR